MLCTSCEQLEDLLGKNPFNPQSGEKPTIVISKSEYIISVNGDTIAVDVMSNVDVDVEIPTDVNWIAENTTRTLSTNTYYFDIAPNKEYEQRATEIVFTNKENNLSERVKIVQSQKDAIILSRKYMNIEREGETVEVKINANVDFEIQIPSEVTWITQVETRAMVENIVYLKVLPNNSDVSRNANITVVNTNSMLSDTLVILQQGNKTSSKIAYSEDQEELEEWTVGLFAGEGSYIMGKHHRDEGYIMTIGNILEENVALVYMDEYNRIREIFIDNSAFAFEYNNNGGVDISIIESGQEVVTEYINCDSYKCVTRLGSDHSQQVGIINLLLNIQGMYDAIIELVGDSGFSKKGTIMFLANKIDAISNLVKALGGPDIFNEDFANWLGTSMNVVGLAELAGMYGASGLLGPIGAVFSSLAGMYSTYLDLYDEHIETYFGNCQAEISNITCKENKLSIDVVISGYEPWSNNIECGVVVEEKSNFAPKYTDGASIKPVTQDGNYLFVEGGIKVNTTYSCRPFVIDKNRTSLWKGFIGDAVGPLVRYGKVKEVEIQCSISTGECVSVTETSAVVKCSYTNVFGLECGVCISSVDGTKVFTTNSVDGERDIFLSSLRPATTYNYWAFVNIDGEPLNGQVKSFTTDLPDVTGTWTCKETHYKNNGEEYYETYTVTLHKDGTATTSSSSLENCKYKSWSRSAIGLSVRFIWSSGDMGHDLNITFDDPTNPTRGIGEVHEWTVSAWGISHDRYYDLEMTK